MSTITLETVDLPLMVAETEQDRGKIWFIEPEPKKDPWDCDYFGIPDSRDVISDILPVHDTRPEIFSDSSPYSLSTHAFTAIKHRSKLQAPTETQLMLSEEAVRNVYFPELTDMMKTVTGAQTIHFLSAAVRAKFGHEPPQPVSTKVLPPDAEPERCGIPLDIKMMSPTQAYIGGANGANNSEKPIGPVSSSHIDYSPSGARQILRQHRQSIRDSAVDIIAAEDANTPPLEARHYAFFSIWRPIKPVRRDPLAICDYKTLLPSRDLVESVNKQPGSVSGDFIAGLHLLQGQHAREQKWYYIKNQMPDEVLILQLYDNHAEAKGQPVGAPHCSPEMLGTEHVKEARESIEVRLVAIW